MTVSTATSVTAVAPVPAIDLGAKRGWRSTKNGLATGLMWTSFVLVLVPVGLVLFTVVSKGIGVVSWSFLTGDLAASARQRGGGMGPAVVGTLLITLAATVLAVPLGILGAVYLHEYGATNRFARVVRFMATVMTGVPSVVMGLFVFVVWTINFGLAGIGGALALACLMLPVVIRSTEEMLRLVPDQLREGAYALGTRKSRTILTVVLPAALPGIVSGCLLAVARAAGETAPLLFTIGASRVINANVLSGATNALPLQIFTNATSSFAPAVERGWGAALVLMVIAFVFMILARVVSSRFALPR